MHRTSRLSRHVSADVGDALPMELWALASVVVDDEAHVRQRIAALRRIERAPRLHHAELARLIVPALHGPPDFAAQVHVALLMLDRSLAVARDADGRFVASSTRIEDAHDHGDGLTRSVPDVGRVAGLDALASLFDVHGGDELPAFLSSRPRDAPAPYRPPANILAERAAADARAERSAKMRELGLDPDDLDDDAPPPKVAFVQRLHAPTIGTFAQGERLTVDGTDLGRVHDGEWWLDERVGDHKRARRLYVRLARDAPSSDVVQRRERAFVVRRSTVTIALGETVLERRIDGNNVVSLVEEERGLIVGVTLLWTIRRPPKKEKG